MPPIRVLELNGSHYEMGYQHGQAFADEIRAVTDERIQLSSDEAWTGRNLSRDLILKLASDCLPYHHDYAPELMQQLQGMSDATGVALHELIIAGGFTDFADVVYNALEREAKVPIYGNECTAWMVNGANMADGHAMLAQTWDMHASATPYVVLIHGQPDDAPEFYALSLTGCVAMMGMNSAGITIGINNLAGADGQAGVTWNFVVAKVLAQTKIEDALECITSARLAGGHNYLLMDGEGHGYNIEAMATKHKVSKLDESAIVHANMCLHEETRELERPLTQDLIDDSEIRVNRAVQYLSSRDDLSTQDLMHITRSREDDSYSVCSISEPPFYSETCAAIVMRPATRDLWTVWGLPIDNEYEHFSLK